MAGAEVFDQLRVCHLIGSLQYGGAERQVVNLLNHLPFEARFVLEIGCPATEGLHLALGADVIRASLPVRLRRLPLDIVRMARLLCRWRIDVLHTHMYWANLIGALAGRLADIPVVVTSEHGKNNWKMGRHRWLERRLISPLVDLRICVSEDIRQLRRDVDGVPAEKLAYLPNGTNLPTLDARPDNRTPVLGSVGRLVEAKDYRTLIEAAARLHDSGMDFHLCIVGDGPERADLERVIAAHELGGVVELVGAQSDVPSWLRGFDVFVLSSIREGQPLALLEAMAHGLPIVATRVGGIPSTVEDGVEAALVGPGRPEELAATLQALLYDRQRRETLGRNARLRAERDFSIEAVATRYAQVYQALWEHKYAVES